MTRRVVVTGMGIVSCIGNSQDEVLKSLQNGTSGISVDPVYKEMGFRTHLHGKPDIDGMITYLEETANISDKK